MSNGFERRNFLLAAMAAAGVVATSNPNVANAQQTPNNQSPGSVPESNPTPAPQRPKLAVNTAKAKVQSTISEVSNQFSNIPPTSSPKVGAANTPIDRTPANATEFTKIVQRMRAQFPIDLNLSTPLNAQFLSLDHDLSSVSVAPVGRLSFFHTESMLDQAAQLFERGITARADWQEKGIKALLLRLELEEFARLDEIHRRETTAGFYTLQYLESFADLEAEQATAGGSQDGLFYIGQLLSSYYSTDEINKQSGFAQLAAWISAYPTFQKGFEGDLADFKWNNDTKKKPDHLHDAATGQSFHSLFAHQLTLLLQNAAYQRMLEVSQRKIRGKQARADWERTDMTFRRDRTQVARDLNDIKYKAATDAGGILNYAEKMRPIKERFNQDFSEAKARMEVAQLGLKLLYGYPDSDLTLPLPSSPQYFDDSLMWVRKAIHFMVRFAQTDQNYVLAISLKGLSTNDAWTKHIIAGAWDFDIPEQLFPDQRHVRLRGISAFVVGDSAKGNIWTAAITPPRNSTCRHMPNSVFPLGHEVKLDQTKIPPCRLGRIETRDSTRPPDVVGISALHNVSPFGTWHISLSPVSSTGTPTKSLADVQIDLHLAIQSVV